MIVSLSKGHCLQGVTFHYCMHIIYIMHIMFKKQKHDSIAKKHVYI